MQLLDFAHREGETANSSIDRFEMVVMTCIDQGVAVDGNLQSRMMLARQAKRYASLKESYLFACSSGDASKLGPAKGPNLQYR